MAEKPEEFNEDIGKNIEKESILKTIVYPILIGLLVGLIVGFITSQFFIYLPIEQGPNLVYAYNQKEDNVIFYIWNKAKTEPATGVLLNLKFIPSDYQEVLYSVVYDTSHKVNFGIIPPNNPDALSFELPLNKIEKRILRESCNISYNDSEIKPPPCYYPFQKYLQILNSTKELFSLEISCDNCKQNITKNITLNSLIIQDCDYESGYMVCKIKEYFVV